MSLYQKQLCCVGPGEKVRQEELLLGLLVFWVVQHCTAGSARIIVGFIRDPRRISSSGLGVPAREWLVLMGWRVRGGGLRLRADCTVYDTHDGLNSRPWPSQFRLERMVLDPGLSSLSPKSKSLSMRERFLGCRGIP